MEGMSEKHAANCHKLGPFLSSLAHSRAASLGFPHALPRTVIREPLTTLLSSLVVLGSASQHRIAMASSSKLSALLLIFMLSISVSPLTLACATCQPGKGKPHRPRTPRGPIVHPPVIKPPPVVVPPINVPPVTPILPPIPPILPPVIPILPPVVTPPVVTPPVTNPGCPPPPAPLTCPVDTLKIGACVDLLGGLVNVKVGDPAANHCCPILGGLLELEAAVCLCTTIKLKLLNLDIFIPIALKLLATCGKTPPPGYTCSKS